MKHFALTLALTAALLHAGPTLAARVEALVEPDRVTLPTAAGQPTNVVRVREAIVQSANRYQWVIVEETPGVLVLKHDKGTKHQAVVRISYDAQGYQLRYVSSMNLNHQGEGPGAQIHPTYNRWVRNLQLGIAQAAGSSL
jgi:phage tail protein X